MKEKPILFNGEMVRAVLAGTKTKTRRLVKLPKGCSFGKYTTDGSSEVEYVVAGEDGDPCDMALVCPYGGPGDRLWVREAWSHDAESLEELRADVEDIVGGGAFGPYYRADGIHEGSGLRWRPSIHMPRWASRISLEVASVRIERVDHISEEDAKAEGVTPDAACIADRCARPHRDRFLDLWNEINGKRATWQSNPFVWVVGFKRLEQSAVGKVA